MEFFEWLPWEQVVTMLIITPDKTQGSLLTQTRVGEKEDSIHLVMNFTYSLSHFHTWKWF